MIVFNVKNQQIEYESCFLIIKSLRNKKIFHLNSPIKIQYVNDREIKNKHRYSFNSLYKKCIIDNNFIEIQDSNSLNNVINNTQDDLTFCFFINDIGESDDIVQFHYFELIRRYENNCYLLIESNNENYFRISDFYQIESALNNKTYSCRYFKEITENQVKRFAKSKNNTSRHFLPLLRTDFNTYSILSKNILELFTFSETELLNFKTSNATDTLLQNNHLIQVVQDFYTKLLNEINHYIKKQQISFDWSKCKETISHTSVLGLCYFLSYLHTMICYETFSINPFEIAQLLLQSEDFAIGTIQLLENALKHSEGGYFCYRMHCSGNKATYLQKNYNIKYNKKTAPFYLEILISDFNEHYSIPQKFIQNLKERLDPDNKVSSELIESFNNALKLKDFFDPSDACKELWQKYYEDTSNVALHYGLNIFEQIVKSAAGKFILTSSNKARLTNNEIYGSTLNNSAVSKAHIPGTQYKIILPIQIVNPQQQSTGLKIQLDIKQLKNNWQQRTIKFVNSESFNSERSKYDIPFSSFKSNAAEYKDAATRKLSQIIKGKVENADKNTIIVFNVEEFSSSLHSEVFSKALICLLGELPLEKIAIINASHQFMSTFIRVFGLLYYKANTHAFLSDSEVYICGHFDLESENNVEVLFKGNSIGESLLASNQMADYKGEYSAELSILESIAKKCEKPNSRRQSVTIFPFDVLIKSNHNTLFQEKTFYDLDHDLQHYHFGCKLSDVHMKVGSKIHITSNFYEATLLFSIKNYISRFAYLLAKDISKRPLKKAQKSNLILIGYETYSETLIIETKNILEQVFNINAGYLIYDDTAKGNKFRSTNHHPDLSNSSYVIIVPIGSTLTTHDKIAAELRRQFQGQNHINIIANLCVVLVRDNAQKATITATESIFWKSITKSSVVLKSNYDIGSNNIVNYIVSVSSKWAKPNECPSCFPQLLSEEKPILKVNKSSVVPMIMMGLNEPRISLERKESSQISHGNIINLKNHLKFGHFKRGDNHFEYYFNTESIIADNTNRKALNQWYRELKRQLTNENKHSNYPNIVKYDFVVAPQHTTNAEFVLQVNEKVFDNPASIIFLDVKKEYRDNIKTKLSNLTQLYTNLVLYGKPAVINFHYVDDTITTGNNFKRTKSLIQSLFPESSLSDSTCGKVKVNVFNSVILLLGRCSSDTKLNYVPRGKFFAFFELNISSMRNHEDACVLCKMHNDYEDMRKLSATNSMENIFSVLAKNYREIKYTEEAVLDQNDGFKRMYFTHELNQRLSELGYEKNDNKKVEEILLNFIIDIFNNVFSSKVHDNHDNCLRILIQVISNPFVIFRKSVLSASFKLLLKTAEYLVDSESRQSNTYLPHKLTKYINTIERSENNSNLKILIKTLFTAISNLGANFVMQPAIIENFFNYIENKFLNDFANNQSNEWIMYYCQVIIQSLMLNRQDSRVLWLEETLTSEECENSQQLLSNNTNIKMLKQIMLLENTLILSDTLDEAVYSIQNMLKNLKEDIKQETNEDLSELENYDSLQQKLNGFDKISEETDTSLLLIILFDKYGQLRNQNKLKEALETTLRAYFCEAFQQFSNITNNSLGAQQILDMSILHLLLLPNSSLSGARKEHLRFYDTLLKQIRTVLHVSKVQLFMTHKKTIDFICSSDGNNMDCDKEYEKCLQEIVDDSSISIGETYYINQSNSRLNTIKVANNSHSNDNIPQTAWYLVFEVQSDLNIQKLLKNARNLLVMREMLLLRFKKDYDNNLYAEFSELRKKVKKLTDDKAGGHTPFAEISAEFDYLYNLSIKLPNLTNNSVVEKSNTQSFTPIQSNAEGKEKIANSMKLITDLLISKLYVCHINEDSYPKQIETRKSDMQYNVLNNYKNIMLCAKSLVLRKDNSLTFRPEITFEVDWTKDFEFMKKSAFIWIAIYYALIMNALRHGKAESLENDRFSQSVRINVSTDETHLVISNKYIRPENSAQKSGITLETVTAFLSHYGFTLQIDENDTYTVKMPLEKNKPTQEGTCNK